MAWGKDAPDAETVFIPQHTFPSVIGAQYQAGQAWRYKNRFSTYCPRRNKKFCAIERLKPNGEEDFWNVQAEVKAAGEKPLSTFGDLFHRLYRAPSCRWSVSLPFRRSVFGGWQQAFKIGRHRGRVYHYDLISAYRWASEQGLPDPTTAYYTTRWDEPFAVWIIKDSPHLPYARDSDIRVVTSEERDFFKLPAPAKGSLLFGVGFRRRIDLSAVWRDLDRKYPLCVKRVARAFWGRWGSLEGPEQVSWGGSSNGKEKTRVLKPIDYNPLWAAFITSRIKLRLSAYVASALHVFVDSILSVDLLPVGGGKVGDWKLVDEYPKGVWIAGTGQWGTGLSPQKHAGISSPQVTAWMDRLGAWGEDHGDSTGTSSSTRTP